MINSSVIQLARSQEVDKVMTFLRFAVFYGWYSIPTEHITVEVARHFNDNRKPFDHASMRCSQDDLEKFGF